MPVYFPSLTGSCRGFLGEIARIFESNPRSNVVALMCLELVVELLWYVFAAELVLSLYWGLRGPFALSPVVGGDALLCEDSS